MKKVYLKMCMLSAAILLMASCSKEETTLQEDASVFEQFNVAKQSKQQQGLFEYARLLSLAIQQKAGMNQELQQKALELRKTGYYEQEFFVGMQGKQSLKSFGNQSLNALLEEVGGEKSTNKINEYLTQHPAMSVLLIGDAKSDQFSNRVYVDNGFDDSDPMAEIFYYENGELHSQTVSEEPTSKAFIVRNSEVYVHEDDQYLQSDALAQSTVLFTHDNGTPVRIYSGAIDPKLVPIDDDFIDDGGSGGGSTGGGSTGGGSIGCTQTCERDCENGTENLWRFRTENDYDGAFKGKGEWFFVIIWADGVNYTLQNGGVSVTGPALSYLRTGQINSVSGDNSWHYPNFSSIIWNREPTQYQPVGDSSRMKVACFESDGGSIKTVSFTLTYSLQTSSAGTFGFNFPVNITINDGDDFIGEYIVEYCHDIGSNGFIYHPADVVDVQHNER